MAEIFNGATNEDKVCSKAVAAVKRDYSDMTIQEIKTALIA